MIIQTKGQIFKEKFGYSKTQRKLMIKYGIPRNNTKEALEHLRNLQRQNQKKKKNKKRLSIKKMSIIKDKINVKLNLVKKQQNLQKLKLNLWTK